MMKVSVIIPNYNHCKYLPRRIDSVLNQTIKPIEIIILDDCSIDGSREVISQYKSEHPLIIKTLYNDKNSGSSFIQWLKGIEMCSGDLIWIAESDDFCEHNFLEELVKPFLSHETLVISFCSSHYINETEAIIPDLSKFGEQKVVVEGSKFLESEMAYGNRIVNASSAIFKKKACSNLPSEILDFKFCGDWLFWNHLLLYGKIYYTPKRLNYFRVHIGNVSNNANKNGLAFIEGLRILKHFNSEFSSRKNIKLLAYHMNEWLKGNVKIKPTFTFSVNIMVLMSFCRYNLLSLIIFPLIFLYRLLRLVF